MKTYISGKITGLELTEAQALFQAAEDVLRGTKCEPVNPMKIAPYNPDWEWHHYMAAYVEALFTCEAIYMLSNWADSRGARIEHAIAEQMGLKITYQRTDEIGLHEAPFAKFKKWLEKNAPTVCKMKRPFTIEEFVKIKKNFTSEQVMELCLQMDNWKELNKKNNSAYRTLLNWHNRGR